jgi:hypothetical protein
MEPKDYTMVALATVLLVSLGFNAMPDATHYCDSKQIKAYCSRLSSTGVTCYPMPTGTTGSKSCTEGWKIMPKIPVTPKKELAPVCDSVRVIAYTNEGKWYCDGIGDSATCINEKLETTSLGGLN